MIFGIDIYSSRLAIIADDGRRLTYAQLGELVAQRAKSLQRGVLQFCLCKNTIQVVFSTYKIGMPRNYNL